MLELYKLLNDMISTICTCYTGHYPTLQDNELKQYPYCEIICNNASGNNEFSDNNQLSINIYDDLDTDINRIENIVTLIHQSLNEFKYISSTMQLLISRDKPHVLTLNDEMLGIARRELRYICRVYQV
jgi:hypothetical protein